MNPYDSLVNFINRHNISPKEEVRLREIIAEIKKYKPQEGEENNGDAVEFIGWIVDEGYEVHSKDAWMRINDNADYAPVLNRQQLYQLFKQDK